jgi:hypothetical protein
MEAMETSEHRKWWKAFLRASNHLGALTKQQIPSGLVASHISIGAFSNVLIDPQAP